MNPFKLDNSKSNVISKCWVLVWNDGISDCVDPVIYLVKPEMRNVHEKLTMWANVFDAARFIRANNASGVSIEIYKGAAA